MVKPTTKLPGDPPPPRATTPEDGVPSRFRRTISEVAECCASGASRAGLDTPCSHGNLAMSGVLV